MIHPWGVRSILIAGIVLVTTLVVLTFWNERSSSFDAEDVNYVVTEMGKCLRDQGNTCYKKVSEDLFERFELPVILEIFRQNEGKQEIFARCHEASHYLGRMEFQKTKSVPLSFHNATEICHGGAYHGVIEGYFDHLGVSLGDPELLEAEVKGVCGNRADYEKATLYSECVHGIGHAMMFITDGELAPSLLSCDSLPNRSDQTTCYGGVFMENSSSSTSQDHPSKYIKADDPFYPCNVLEERYLETCYSYQSSYFGMISKYDWTKVADLCRQVPENYRVGCFRIIGTNQVGFTQDMKLRKNNCELIPEDVYRTHCFNGVVGGLVGRYHQDFPLITSFCSILPEKDQEACYTDIGYAMRGWVEKPSDLEKECRTIEIERYANACLKAGGA